MGPKIKRKQAFFHDESTFFGVHLIVKEGQCWDVNGPSFGVCVPSHSLSAWGYITYGDKGFRFMVTKDFRIVVTADLY